MIPRTHLTTKLMTDLILHATDLTVLGTKPTVLNYAMTIWQSSGQSAASTQATHILQRSNTTIYILRLWWDQYYTILHQDKSYRCILYAPIKTITYRGVHSTYSDFGERQRYNHITRKNWSTWVTNTDINHNKRDQLLSHQSSTKQIHLTTRSQLISLQLN